MKKLSLLLVALSVSGCVTTDRHAALPPSLATIPPSLKAKCAGLVNIPDRDLTQAETSALWAKDRAALGSCIRKDEKLSKAVSILESQGRKP